MREVSCGFIIVNNDKKVLLGKTSRGHYTVFKGKMEKGEILLDTALRELREESGIDLNNIENIWDYVSEDFVFTYRLKNKDVFLFLLEDEEGLLDNVKLKCESTYNHKGKEKLEIEGYKWIKIKNMNKYIFPSQKGIKKFLMEKYGIEE